MNDLHKLNLVEAEKARVLGQIIEKASPAIFSEIRLDKLLSNLIKLFIKNAGAQTGFIILDKTGEWIIEASVKVDSDNVTVLQHSLFFCQFSLSSNLRLILRTNDQ
jgi:hypothetical protein